MKAKKRFYETHPNAGELFDRDIYKQTFFHFFCENKEEYITKITGGLFPEQAIDAKKFLEEYFGLEL